MTRPGSRLTTTALLGAAVALLLACSPPAASPAPAKPAAPAAAATAPAVSAAPTAAPQAAPPAPPRKMELGVVALVSYFYPMWIAVEKGFFAQQGLDVEMTTFQTNEAVAALVSGSLDVLMCPTDACVTAVSKGAPIRQVNDYLSQAPYDLIVRADITRVADLRGKRVGVSSLNAGTGSLAKIMLRAQGFGPDDYQLIQAGGNPARFTALQSGGVDASLLSDPQSFIAIQEGYRSILTFSEVVPEYSFTSDWVLNGWLDEARNRDALVRFQAGQLLANRWAQEPANRAAVVDLIAKNTRATPQIAERSYEFYAVQNPTIIAVDTLQEQPTMAVVNILREMEGLDPLPPTAQWRDGSYIQQARQLADRR